ncbi:recombinase family protein [Deinococcus depolymerans]|uniref:Recombinase family protein n=1 Tax=Deinococcus depolymerans TaxID=392408 RepID=A0ABN1C1D7_9DEIO
MTPRIYLRVSTADQAEKGFSLDAQREKALAWCRYEGLEGARLYPDAGLSGKRDDRPALTQLLRDLQAGDVVIVYALSRLGRGGAIQLLSIIGQIREAGARLVSLTEHIDTETSAGRLMLTILAALAELEVEQTRERTEAGRLEAARQGIYPHASDSLPTGWMRGEDGRLVESPDADVVRLIFSQGRAPYNATAELLNAQGLTGPRGGRWQVPQVRRIVQYPYWQGYMNYRQTVLPDQPASWIRIPAPALVTQDVWQAAQRDARTNHAHKRPDKFPLTGHLLCACGTPLQGRDQGAGPAVKPTHNRRRAYTCYPRVRGSDTCPSNGRSTRNWYTAEEIADQARALLATYLSGPSDPAHLHVLTGLPAATDPHAEERADVERRLTALARMQLDGAIDYADYRTLRAELMAQREAIPPVSTPIRSDLPDLTNLAEAVCASTNEALAELLDILDVTFQIGDDGVALRSVRPFAL